MKIETFEWKRISRPGGGLFIGLKIHYPCRLTSEDLSLVWWDVMVNIGFLLWQLNFDVVWGKEKRHP